MKKTSKPPMPAHPKIVQPKEKPGKKITGDAGKYT
jgi:hypothetical protein